MLWLGNIFRRWYLCIHIDFGKKYEEIGSLDRALKEYKTAYEIDSRDKKILKKISELSKKMS